MKDTDDKESSIPDSILMKLYDASGSDVGDKGFLIFYVNEEGKVACLSKAQGQVIEMGIIRCVEAFVKGTSFAPKG